MPWGKIALVSGIVTVVGVPLVGLVLGALIAVASGGTTTQRTSMMFNPQRLTQSQENFR